jgi:glutathione S-transferase
MKLYVTMTSPYARIVRAAILEHGLQDRIEVVPARTRETHSPYYRTAPSGRVPYLERDDGPGLEETDVICAFLDHLSERPALVRPHGQADWQAGRCHALARSLLDGLAVWVREMRRPEEERSPTIIAHEADRARRLLDLWEMEIETPAMRDPVSLTHLTLFSALEVARAMLGEAAIASRPNLADWHVEMGQRPSLIATRPPERS